MTSMATCRSCGAPILWIRTQDGKRMPLDANPLPHNVLGGWIIDGPVGRPYEPLFDSPARTRYQAHWATCPKAKQHPR